MPKHNVRFDLPERELGNVDAHFHIYQDAAKLGRITISKGGMDYYPANKKNPHTLSWSEFDKMVKEWKSDQ